MEIASDEILAENVYLLLVNAKNMHGSDMNKLTCSEETPNFMRAIKKVITPSVKEQWAVGA